MPGFTSSLDEDLRRPFGVQPSASTPSSSGWDPTFLYPNFVAVRGPIVARTVTDAYGGGGYSYGARGTKFGASSRSYIEFCLLLNHNLYSSPACGFMNAVSSYINALGADMNSCGLYANGSYTYARSNTATVFDAIYGGDIIGMALDSAVQTTFISRNGAWAGGGTPGNGATAYPVPSGPLFPAASMQAQGDGAVIFTGANAMVYGPPPGFQAWG